MNSETLIGQYKIVRTLGAGGMGTVYLGEHLLLGRRAAIKTLLPALSIHREIVDRFFNEARAISAISDPGVVQIFDFGYHVDGTAYIVMEFLEGENLATRIDRVGKLALLDSLRIARMIASSLHAAHERGIIHRDLKPGNVFVIRDSDAPGGERTKILDFGICKLQNESEASTTQTGVMLGTPVYMSPEQCRGSSRVDARSDLYSAGCVLFHMLTGRTPFDCESIGEFIACHLKVEPEAPSKVEPSLPPAVDAVVLRCLAKNPEDRFQTMRDLQGALDDIIATLSDPGHPVTASHMNATPLAEGFKSGFDVNHSSSSRATVGGRPSRPSNPWFVDSMAPVAATSIGDDEHEHAWVKPDRGMSLPARAALVLVLFIGLIGGIAATSAALTSNDRSASTATSTAPTTPGDLVLPPSDPAMAAPPAIPPAPPITSGDGIEPELATDAITRDGDEEPTTQVEPPKKVERPPPNRKWRPQPRRHVEPDEPEAKPEEDLYDTR